ncbi:MAG TPA: acyl-CoA desaturase [Pyrinomonadaceae bacterium]|jgi:stearoyl-CoA desaturase (delta-9 desaturase)
MRKHKLEELDLVTVLFFIIFHLAAMVGVLVVGISLYLVGLGILSYVLRVWVITAGYHRYFAHRSFKTSRAFQFIIGLLGTLAIERGPLWWATMHRLHHRYADQERDVHSPLQDGTFWAYIGWMTSQANGAMNDYSGIKDFSKYPELRWLNRFYIIPPLIAGTLLAILCSPAVFVWVGLVGTVLQWHTLFFSNTACHIFGSRRFNTNDTSKNNFFCALILMGEGWHNNHHYYARSARQGFYWWEVDMSYYSIKLLEKLRLVWDVREIPQHILAKGLRSASANAGGLATARGAIPNNHLNTQSPVNLADRTRADS